MLNLHDSRDKVLDLYEKTPASVLALTNLLPVLPALTAYLSYHTAEREKNNLLIALCELQKDYKYILNILGNLDDDYVEQQGPELMNLYFEHCKNTYSQEKINFFRNVWINGMIKEEQNLEEKAYMFDLVSSLTLEQIQTLKIVYDEKRILDIGEISERTGIDNTATRHICLRLQGAGFLQIADIGGIGQRCGGNEFVGTEYLKILAGYLMEPDTTSEYSDIQQIQSPDSDHS